MTAIAKALADTSRSYVNAKASVASMTSDILAQGPSGITPHRADLSKAKNQLQHFAGWVYSSIRPIAQRIAGQPIHVSKAGQRRPSRRKKFSDLDPLDSHEILDLLAELYKAGVILKSGQFNKEQKSDRYRLNGENNQPEFVIAWKEETSIGKDVVITQKDIRQIQLAKGALYAGCKLMMKRLGLEGVDRVKIAGAFGTHVESEKALIMGLFPDCEIERVSSVGNAAGDGARIALLNRDKRVEANWISRNVEYVELTIEENFQKEFTAAMHLPHMKDPFPHLEGILPDDILNQE